MQRPGKQPMRGLCRKRKGGGSRRTGALKYGRIFAGLHTGMLFVFCDEQPYDLAMLAHSHEEGAPEDEGEVYAFYMHPSIWGTPATKWAFLFCLQRLKDMGYRSAVVWVLEENRRDRRFYEKHRFSSECVYQQIEIGAKLREMRYAKTL